MASPTEVSVENHHAIPTASKSLADEFEANMSLNIHPDSMVSITLSDDPAATDGSHETKAKQEDEHCAKQDTTNNSANSAIIADAEEEENELQDLPQPERQTNGKSKRSTIRMSRVRFDMNEIPDSLMATSE